MRLYCIRESMSWEITYDEEVKRSRGEEEHGKPIDPKKRLSYIPNHSECDTARFYGFGADLLLLRARTIDRTNYLWFKGSWMSVTRTQSQGDYWNRNEERLSITYVFSLFTSRRILCWCSFSSLRAECFRGRFRSSTRCSSKPSGRTRQTPKIG